MATDRAASGTFQATDLQDLAYTQADWDDECFANFGEGRDPAPCPACGRTGFYGPRIEDPDRRYRACRFCGFTQDVDGAAQRYRPTAHDCAPWPTCAKAPYLWWVAPGVASYTCPFCRERAVVSKCLVSAPVDDSNHPWWKVPQRRNRAYYVRFWENWDPTKGRVYL